MRKPLISLAVTASLLVAACGTTATQAPTKGPTTAPTTAATAAPIPPDITKTNYRPEPVGKRGGKVLVGLVGEPNMIWYNIYDTFASDVVAFGPALWGLWNNTSDLKYYGQLATNVPTTVNGGVTVTGERMDVKVDLIPGAQWSDGQPITCADVDYMTKWIMDKENTGLQVGTAGYEDVASIDGGSGTSCVIHFKKVFENFLSLWSPLLPAHYLKTSSVPDAVNNLYTNANPEKGVYSGPYIPTAWAAGAQIDFKANTKFWETIRKAQAPLDGWTLVLRTDETAMISSFAKGEIDAAVLLNHNHLAAIKAAAIPDAQVDVVDSVIYEHNTWNYAGLVAKFGDAGAKAMMEALHYAYDKEAITTRILGKSANPSCSFTSPLTWFFADIPCYKTDVAKAADILSKAGFTKGTASDGTVVLVAPNGTKAELLACARSNQQWRVDTLTLLASQLAPLGIKLKVTAVQPAILLAGWNAKDSDVPCNVTHGNYDVAEFAWIATPDPTSIYQLYHSKFDPSKGDHSGQNFSRTNIPALDKLLDENNSTLDLLKIKENMATAQRLYVDPANAFPEIALYNWRIVMLKSPKLHNISNNGSAATQTWNIEDWWRE
jgi:ABC-type transport system substrate-binding protein